MSKTKSETQSPPNTESNTAEEVAYLAKRHRVSPAIIQEIIRRIGSAEGSAVEREIRKGLMRR